jgi:hypothetical protein
VFGQQVTFTATVAPTINGFEPTGTVNFFDGTNPIGSGTLKDVNGVATATFQTALAQLSGSSHSITASYDGSTDAHYASSTSGPFVLVVSAKATSTTVSQTSPSGASTFGQPVTFTITVAPTINGVEPHGTVALKEGSTTLASGTVHDDGSGTAIVTLQTGATQLLGGNHTLTAFFTTSDGNYASSNTGPFVYTVNPATTTATFTQVTPASPTLFGTPVSFTVTVTPALGGILPTGTVALKDGSNTLDTEPLQDVGGVATATLTASAGQLSGGSHTITAVYAPGTDLNYATSSASVPYSVTAVTTTTTLTSIAPSAPSYGQAITFTAQVTPTLGNIQPTGKVTFEDGGTVLGTGTLQNVGGVATATYTTAVGQQLSVGSHPIQALYTPALTDMNYQGSSSGTTNLSVSRGATTTTISQASPASPSTFGQPVTFTVTVAPNFGVVAPTGTVTLYDGTTALGSGNLQNAGNGTATAVFTTAVDDLKGGDHTITAVYAPGTDLNYLGGTSPNFDYFVNPSSTTTTITQALPASPAPFGTSVTFTATVLPTFGSTRPTGTVQFFDGSSNLLGSATLTNVGGTATVTFATTPTQLTGGTHLITATYVGPDGNYAGSSGTMNFIITPLATATTVTQASPAAPTFGQAVTFTATVTPTIGTVSPTGTVTFFDNNVAIGTSTLNSVGPNNTATATYTTTTSQLLSVSTHQITAKYLPGSDPNYLTSTSATPLNVTVSAAPTTTTITRASPASPSTFGTAVTLTATVAPSFGSTEPTGTVQFFDNGTLLGTGTLSNVGNTATASLLTTATQLMGGVHTNITAVYVGPDVNYKGSTSAPFSYTVNQAPTATTLTQESPASPSTFGQSVTFTATVTSNVSGVVPTGTVTFEDNGTPFGTGTLAKIGGVATATFATGLTQLTGGSHNITAVYGSDGNYQMSTSPVVTYGVNAADTTTTITQASPTTTTFGTPVTFTATVSTSVTGAAPTGTVTFQSDGTPIGTGTLTNSGGVTTASYTTTAGQLLGGTHNITAVFATGDANFAGSTTLSGFSYTVSPAATTTTVTKASPASPDVFGTAVTFTATVTQTLGGIAPTGTVTFKADGQVIGTGSLATVGGVATATFTTAAIQLQGGTHSITADFTSADNNYASGSSVSGLTYMVNPAASTTTITQVSPASPSVFGTPVTFTATVTSSINGVTPTGTVLFQDGATMLGTATLQNVGGVATATFPTTPAVFQGGSHSITATYQPGSNLNFASSVSGSAISYTVNQATSSTSAPQASPPTSSAYGTQVTFTTTVTPTIGGVAPSGTVTFEDNGTSIGTGTLQTISGVATASFQTALAQLLGGSHSITAVYGSDRNYLTSTSGNTIYSVTGATTTTTVTQASPANPDYGQAVTLTATVASVPGGVAPTGVVTFKDSGTPIGTGTLQSVGGVATAILLTTATQFNAGSHSITADYNPAGDKNYTISTSTTPFILAVNQAGVTTTVSTTLSPGAYGVPIITAKVVPTNPGAGIPTGNVTFENNGTPIATGTLTNVNGIATATLSPPLDAGTYTITAQYNGSPNFSAGNLSNSIPQTITKAGTSLSVTASPSAPIFGQAVTFTATVTTTSGNATPTGTVTFTVDGTSTTEPVDSNGQATLTEPLAAGNHSVSASYSGGTDFQTSTGALSTPVRVAQSGTTTALAVSTSTFFNGQPITLTATVTGASGAGVPTGTVTFFDGSAVLGTVGLSGGQASITAMHLAAGGHAFRAVYSGDSNFAGSAGQAGAVNQGDPISVVVVRSQRRPKVEVFDRNGTMLFSFFPYGKSFHGQVRIRLADVDGDGFPDVIVAPGAGPVEPVVVYNGKTGAHISTIQVGPHAFARGLFVAAGDINGDGRAEVIVGVGPEVRGFVGATGQQLFRFAPFGRKSKRSVRVAVVDLNGDGIDEFMAVVGSQIAAYNGQTQAPVAASAVAPFAGQILGQANS